MKDELPKITAWDFAKNHGTTLSRVAELYGCGVSNLAHKYKSKPQQFEIICLGAAAYDQKYK